MVDKRMEDIVSGSYLPRKWVAFELNNLAARLGGQKNVIDGIAESIQRGIATSGRNVPLEDARVWASAIVRRGMDDKHPSKLFLSVEARNDLVDILRENGVTDDARIERLINVLTLETADRKTPSFAKFRIPMDYSHTFSDGTRVVDLLEGNVDHLMRRYIENTSGRTALAEIGYKGDVDFDNLYKAIDEYDMRIKQEKEGAKDPNSKELIEDAISQLIGRPRNGIDRSPWAIS